MKELSVRRLPYLGVVHGGREAGRKVSVKSLHHFKPPPSPEQAVVWLNRTLEVRRERGGKGGGEGEREGSASTLWHAHRFVYKVN